MSLETSMQNQEGRNTGLGEKARCLQYPKLSKLVENPKTRESVIQERCVRNSFAKRST